MACLAVVVPVVERDRALLSDLLSCLKSQTHPPAEVLVATPASLELSAPGLPLRIVDNPGGAIAAGLNRAIASSGCDFILRLDVRARPLPDYVDRCLATLERGPDVVGGRLDISAGGPGSLARAIAVAAGHPLGAGDARYRIGGEPGSVDTVPYSCFRRDLWLRLGGYNESLYANEDYEYNWRVRWRGGTVWFEPGIRSGYLARRSLGELAAQYFRYGWWKAQMLRQHPRSLRLRQLAPVAALGLLAALALGALFDLSLAAALAAAVAAYLALMLGAAAQAAVARRQPALALWLPAAFAVIHFSWAGGAWLNLLTLGRWPRPM